MHKHSITITDMKHVMLFCEKISMPNDGILY
jgi:hypothetical protein